MIAVQDPDVVLSRFWDELRAHPDLAGLVALIPSDHGLNVMSALQLVPAVLARLGTSADQLRVLDALGHAYVRARGLHFTEE